MSTPTHLHRPVEAARAGSPERRQRRAHALFWALLFVLFPLAIMPKELLALVPGSVIRFPENGFAEVLLPKLGVFAVLWGLGAYHSYLLWRRGELELLRRGSPLRRPFLWLALFLAASLLVSLLNPAPLGLSLPLIPSRYESILFRLLENAWYALTFIAAALSASGRLRPTWALHLLALGACLAGAWALLEAYGIDPLRLVDPDARVGINVQAKMGHQGYVAAYVAVVLVFWTSWRLLLGRLRALDLGIITLLSAALVASGGRAGILAALAALLLLTVALLRRKRHRRELLLLAALLLLGGALPLLTSQHAQTRLNRLGTAVQGEDPATSHRFVFWQVGAKAIRERPLTGYGIDAFGNAAWFFATPEQAAAMLTEFLPPETAARAFRLGNLALYRTPDSGGLELQPVKPYRVHNYFLDIAFASGVPVLLLFTLFVASAGRALLRARTPLALATLLALVTYMIYGLVWFATPNVDTLVWGLVGLGLGSLHAPERPEGPLKMPANGR
jgi:O-antigen ligase